MKTKHAAYNLYLKRCKSGKSIWYVRFWDAVERKYNRFRSTGVEASGKNRRRREADDVARALLLEFSPPPEGRLLVEYVLDYWRPDHPHFIEHEVLTGRRASLNYINKNFRLAKARIESYAPFRGMRLGGLSSFVLRKWMLDLAAESHMGASQILRCMAALRGPLSFAVQMGDLENNPFSGVKPPPVARVEKGCLTREEILTIIKTPFDPRRKLAVLLGALCGMRLGEARGLCFDDVDFVNGVIHIRHNWQDGEGLKSPKYGSFRDVLLPSILEPLFARVSGSGGFVFAPAGFDRPVSGTAIRAWFYDMLGLAGIDKTKRLARNITFHSTRHTFITLGRHDMEINDIDMQAFAGHKRGAMTAHYTHPKQVVNMPEAREKLESFIGGARRADVHGRQSANDLFFLRKNAKNCLTNKKRRRYPVYRQR